jgi:hypothetical protein
MLRWDGFWDGLVCPAIEALLFGGPALAGQFGA